MRMGLDPNARDLSSICERVQLQPFQRLLHDRHLLGAVIGNLPPLVAQRCCVTLLICRRLLRSSELRVQLQQAVLQEALTTTVASGWAIDCL